MAQRSGPDDQTYSLVGEGVIMITPKGGDPDIDAVDYHWISWEANREIDKLVVTNTSDYNATTKLMNDRSIITGDRLTGTLHGHHNADPIRDVLLTLPPGTYPHIRCFVTQGQLAVTGPPLVAAIRRCYFELTEANLGPYNLGGGEVKGVRPVDIGFESNGVFQYVSEAVPVGP